jgi:hypothetical protein
VHVKPPLWIEFVQIELEIWYKTKGQNRDCIEDVSHHQLERPQLA